MGRPRKIQNEIALDSDEDVKVVAEKIVESFAKQDAEKDDAEPFWVIDPRSRVVKRLWTYADLSLHLAHLKTRSFATHMALGEFYNDIVEKADSIAEAYQGCEGKLLNIPYLKNTSKGSIEKILRGHTDWIAANRYKIISKDETSIQNLIDEAVETYQRVLYKLKFLS
jgi:DNA-binding ferritin-like protein